MRLTMVIIKKSVLIDLHEKAKTHDAAVKPVWHNYIIIILQKIWFLQNVECKQKNMQILTRA